MRPSTPRAKTGPDHQDSADGAAQAGTPHGTPMLSPRARAGLVLLAVLMLVWISTLPGHEATGRVRTAGHGIPETPGLGVIVDLQISALDRKALVFEPGRNIFTFPPPPLAHRSEEKDPQQQETKKDEEKRRQPPQDPALEIAFLGIFGPERLRIAVLEDEGGTGISNILEHDVVDGRYRVVEIDSESILLRDTLSPSAAPIRFELPRG